MSIKLGNISITNLAENKVENAHTLLDFKWTDHILNDVSWLRADTFSWHSGLVYIGAYQHLVDDIASITPETETIGSYTITFYRALDGHKIVLPDQIDTLQSIYETEGVAWYYILDTTNTQFKLPRTKWGFTGLRDNVGNYISQNVLLPNITGGYFNADDAATSNFGCVYTHESGQDIAGQAGYGAIKCIDASRSSSVYSGNGTNTLIQPRSTQMYLYFYVGEFTQTALQQTAGITTAQLNNKIDIDHTNDTKPYLKECYVNGTSGYNIWSNGYCEQWGITPTYNNNNSWNVITLTKNYKNTQFNVQVSQTTSEPGNTSWSYPATTIPGNIIISTSQIKIGGRYVVVEDSSYYSWKTSGYLAEGEY